MRISYTHGTHQHVLRCLGHNQTIFSIQIAPTISSCHILAEKLIFSEIPELYYTNTEWPTKKCIHSLLINIFGINLNEISISG